MEQGALKGFDKCLAALNSTAIIFILKGISPSEEYDLSHVTVVWFYRSQLLHNPIL